MLLLVGVAQAPQGAARSLIDLTDAGGTSIPVTHRTHESVAVKVDGKLDETIWADLPEYTGFSVIQPDTLAAPAWRTSLRLLQTERGLYVAAYARQPVETLVERLASRDARNVNGDSMSITLDTSGEGRYGYWFNVKLGGSLSDGTVLPERRFSSRWDGPWRGASGHVEDGWVAEYFLPWSMMAMPEVNGPRTIGMYFSREVASRAERWSLPALPGTQPRFMSALQPLELQPIAQRRQLVFYPYASATADRVRNDAELDAGADIFWRPTTNLQLTTTLNPDFGTVESDDVVVNLTSFENFFPERRAFFLEGQEVFETTPRSDTGRFNPTTLLNTRRIGSPLPRPELPPDTAFESLELNQPTELYGAVKATGQRGPLRFGALAAFEEDQYYEGVRELSSGERAGVDIQQRGRQFGVVRVLQESTGERGYRALGGMATLVAHPDAPAHALALDGHLLSANGHWKVDGQILRTDVQRSSFIAQNGGTGYGAFADVSFRPRQGRQHSLELDYFDEQLDLNSLGFLRRNDLIGLRYNYLRTDSNLDHLRERRTRYSLQQELNHRGHIVNSAFRVARRWTLHSLANIRANYTYINPRWEDRDSRGNGEYRIEERNFVGLTYESNRSKPLSYEIRGDWREEDLGGQHFQTTGQLSLRPSDRLAFNLQVSHRNRDGWLVYRSGRNLTTYEAEEWRPKVDMDLFLSARQQFRVSFQWTGIKAFDDQFFEVPLEEGSLDVRDPEPDGEDFSVSRLTLQLRYRWEIAPLSDLFLVYTRTGSSNELIGDSFSSGLSDTFASPVGEQLVVKLRYRFDA